MFAFCVYIVACVMGFLMMASEGAIGVGMTGKQFALAMFVYGPLFVVGMLLIQVIVEATVYGTRWLVRYLWKRSI